MSQEVRDKICKWLLSRCDQALRDIIINLTQNQIHYIKLLMCDNQQEKPLLQAGDSLCIADHRQ
uniref:Uncharacterized protein n=1 Tax=Arundo donax TaxID=35708 RepID=A0A0A8YSJ7_ARUDO